MNEIALKFTPKIFSLTTQAEFEKLLHDLTAFLGMDGFTFFFQSISKELHLLDSRPEDFLNHYHEKNWTFFDPVVREAYQKRLPLLWSEEVKPATATQKIIYRTGQEAGLRDGFLFTVNDGFENACLSFYGQTIGGSTSDAYFEQYIQLQIFTQSFYLAFKGLLTKTPELPKSSPLSDREYEILVLMAEGYSNPQIGQRLSIATDTVKEHIGKLSKKLNSKNRAHSVALSYRNQYLDI